MRERKLRQFVTDPEEASPYLDVLRSIADYQFGIGTAPCLFNSESSFTIQRSVNTWRIRNVLLDGKLFLVLRPQDGLFSITVFAAELLKKCSNPPRLRVTVNDEVIQAIMKEGNVFAKHVINVDRNLRAGDEAIIVNNSDELIAVGKMRLSGEEVMEYKRGVAVTVKERCRIRK